VNPRRGRTLANEVEPLVNGVVRADQQLRSCLDEPCRGFEHHLTDRIPAIFVNEALIAAQRESVQRNLGMLMRPE
jgi:hypothetical protein